MVEKRRILVTGSTSGIGKGIALYLANLGHIVVVHGLERTDADRVRDSIVEAGGEALSVVGDIADPGQCAALVQDAVDGCGGLDVLVNNAGRNVFTGVLASDPADWEDAMNVDLRAAWLISRAAAPHMPPGSAIVNIASNHAFSTIPGCFPYNVAKAGVIALTQSLALELAPLGIRANAVCPGYIDTPINDTYFSTFADPDAERERVVRLHPARRLGTPQDVAHAVRFLALGEESGFITGTHLLVDGGRSALLQDPR